jgi:uncharacterized protein YndB with AHSA1/START domain
MTTKNDVAETVVIERTFNARVERVWKALTDVDEMRGWYFDLKEFRPEKGFEFAFIVEHEGMIYDHRCKITEVVPQRKLAYTWRYEGHEGDSLVTFQLFPDGDKTRLKLTHEGLETFPKLPSFARENFVKGWTDIIGSSLKEFLEKDEAANVKPLVITRILNAPRELVFKMWTDPKHMAQWWGPEGFTNPVCELDVRPGGAIRIDMRGPDGAVYPMTGTFREISEPERLVFTAQALDEHGTAALEVLNTVTFAEKNGKTTLTLQARVTRATAKGKEYLEGMEPGWTQSLERLTSHVAKQSK